MIYTYYCTHHNHITITTPSSLNIVLEELVLLHSMTMVVHPRLTVSINLAFPIVVVIIITTIPSPHTYITWTTHNPHFIWTYQWSMSDFRKGRRRSLREVALIRVSQLGMGHYVGGLGMIIDMDADNRKKRVQVQDDDGGNDVNIGASDGGHD